VCGHPLVRNRASKVVHLVVPAGLIPSGAPAKSFCGWPYGTAEDLLVDAVPLVHKQICEKCFPGLRRKVKARLLAMAAEIASVAAPPPDLEPEDEEEACVP